MTVDMVLQNIKELCEKYHAEQIILFGSRAKGTALERSDIDIAVSGVDDFDSLLDAVDAIQTLYTIDLLNMDTCGNELILEDIKSMDAKFEKRWESFTRSLESLAEARERDLSDSFVLSGTSAKFSITFDLAWKVMKDILVQCYAITDFIAGSPREVLRAAYKAELISDDIWMEMLKVRNQLSHDYDGVIVKEYCQRIIHEYIDLLYEFGNVQST